MLQIAAENRRENQATPSCGAGTERRGLARTRIRTKTIQASTKTSAVEFHFGNVQQGRQELVVAGIWVVGVTEEVALGHLERDRAEDGRP